eukprot:2462084-Karenia_brevis.AAC.1
MDIMLQHPPRISVEQSVQTQLIRRKKKDTLQHPNRISAEQSVKTQLICRLLQSVVASGGMSAE